MNPRCYYCGGILLAVNFLKGDLKMKKLVYSSTIILMIVFVANAVTAGAISGKVTVKSRRLTGADVLIFVEKVGDNNFAPAKEHAKIDQINFVFTPYILPIVVGTTVDFHNSDNALHNVFTPSKVSDKGGFNLGNWGKGLVRSYTFKKCVAAVILCKLHPEMIAYVVTLKNPYFAVTDKDAKFTIPAIGEDKKPVATLPAGKYKLWAWHPRLKSVFQEVQVPADGVVNVDF